MLCLNGGICPTKKVLIIADLFYASPRIPGLAKYLPEFGWQAAVLTTRIGEDPDSRFGPPLDFRKNSWVIETTDYSSKKGTVSQFKKRVGERYKHIKPFLRFLYRRYSEIVDYPDVEKEWKPWAIKAGTDLLKNEDIEAIISSSSPVTVHIIARQLKNAHHIPWIADFRDLWTQNHNYPYSRLREIFERKLELRTLSTADALVTISQSLAEELGVLHKRRVYAITNGFDPDEMSDGKASITAEFTITYTGQVYARQDPSKLFAALKDLMSERTMDPKSVEVRFYGPVDERLSREAAKYGLSELVKQYGIISRQSAFEKQRESQLLFQINWEDPKKKGLYSGKIFEYLAAQRPILATGHNETVEKLIQETHSGIYCPTVGDIKNALRESYSEYKLEGVTQYHGDLEGINRYSYREMARRFAEILERVTIAGG